MIYFKDNYNCSRFQGDQAFSRGVKLFSMGGPIANSYGNLIFQEVVPPMGSLDPGMNKDSHLCSIK